MTRLLPRELWPPWLTRLVALYTASDAALRARRMGCPITLQIARDGGVRVFAPCSQSPHRADECETARNSSCDKQAHGAEPDLLGAGPSCQRSGVRGWRIMIGQRAAWISASVMASSSGSNHALFRHGLRRSKGSPQLAEIIRVGKRLSWRNNTKGELPPAKRHEALFALTRGPRRANRAQGVANTSRAASNERMLRLVSGCLGVVPLECRRRSYIYCLAVLLVKRQREVEPRPFRDIGAASGEHLRGGARELRWWFPAPRTPRQRDERAGWRRSILGGSRSALQSPSLRNPRQHR